MMEIHGLPIESVESVAANISKERTNRPAPFRTNDCRVARARRRSRGGSAARTAQRRRIPRASVDAHARRYRRAGAQHQEKAAKPRKLKTIESPDVFIAD